MGGHSDSWDVGQGAIDDGGGFFSGWQAAVTLKQLIDAGTLPCPRRSIRVVLWVDEEISQRGAATYYQKHVAELPDHIIAIESDIGNFNPYAFGFTGLPEAKAILTQIGSVLLGQIGVGNITDDGADTDNGPLCDAGVPCGSLESTGNLLEMYFWYHHSNADSISHMRLEGMRDSISAMAVLSYVLADMQQRLPSALQSQAPTA